VKALLLLCFGNFRFSFNGKLMLNGMRQDFSWGLAATRYEQIFSWALMDPPYC
jgi:starch synthase